MHQGEDDLPESQHHPDPEEDTEEEDPDPTPDPPSEEAVQQDKHRRLQARWERIRKHLEEDLRQDLDDFSKRLETLQEFV